MVRPEMLCGFEPVSRKPYHLSYPGLKFTACGWEYMAYGEKIVAAAPPAWAVAVSGQNTFLDTLEPSRARRVSDLYKELMDRARRDAAHSPVRRDSLTQFVRQKRLDRRVRADLRSLLRYDLELQSADTAGWGSLAANCSELRAVRSLIRALR